MFSRVFEVADYDFACFGALPALLTAHLKKTVFFADIFILHKIDDRCVPNLVFGVADFQFLFFSKLPIFVFHSGLQALPGCFVPFLVEFPFFIRILYVFVYKVDDTNTPLFHILIPLR